MKDTNCCICQQPGATGALYLSREISTYRYEDIPLLPMLDIAPIRTLRYQFHNGPCEVEFSHAAGFHDRIPDGLCDSCIETMAKAELLSLSEAAKAVLFDAIRNPLCVMILRLEMSSLHPHEGMNFQELLDTAFSADRNLTELLGRTK